MKKRILSLCLMMAVAVSSGVVPGMAVRASEEAGEGASTSEMQQDNEFSQESEEYLAPSEWATPAVPDPVETTEQEVYTDAAGQLITPETAQAIENADLGLTDMEKAANAEPEAAEVAAGAEEALSTPEDADSLQMDKSTIGAAFDSTYQFIKEDAVVYLSDAAVVKTEPSDEAQDMASLAKYTSIRLTGSSDAKYWEVTVGGQIGYIDSAVIIRDASEIEALKEDDARKEETEAESRQEQEEVIVEKASEAREEWTQVIKETRREELANQTRSLNWNGPVLSRSKGSVYGPSGKETYYNLNMSGCVSNMNRRGYYYEVWVRNDGCKMFGDYIMCAANLGVHPFGSLVECSLGTCIVVDTGGFAAGNPNQLDIAVTW